MRQTITFTEPQAEWLKAEAARLGVTVSEAVRRLVEREREEEVKKSKANFSYWDGVLKRKRTKLKEGLALFQMLLDGKSIDAICNATGLSKGVTLSRMDVAKDHIFKLVKERRSENYLPTHKPDDIELLSKGTDEELIKMLNDSGRRYFPLPPTAEEIEKIRLERKREKDRSDLMHEIYQEAVSRANDGYAFDMLHGKTTNVILNEFLAANPAYKDLIDLNSKENTCAEAAEKLRVNREKRRAEARSKTDASVHHRV